MPALADYPPDQLSWWQLSSPLNCEFNQCLEGEHTFDVAIVGAGFTGLWSAYYLNRLSPELKICVLERDGVGYGASGRNGGWCIGSLTGTNAAYEKKAKGGALAMMRAMHDTVDEVGRVAQYEGIDCDFAKGGALYFAVNSSQSANLQKMAQDDLDHGADPADVQVLNAQDTLARLKIAGIRDGLFYPNCAAIHPFKLASGLARVVAESGVAIFEQTDVIEIGNNFLRTTKGAVKAGAIIRATEGYGSTIKGHERAIAPIHSTMIMTQAFSDAQWDEIGLRHREVFADGRNLLYHGQRTADGRMAMGGLGALYRFGSGTELHQPTIAATAARLQSLAEALFPSLGPIEIAHQWGGAVGVPRDQVPSVGFDKDSGFAWGGGYLGEGVAAANLAGRCLADLITGRDSDLAKLPWVNHRSRNWEPEPVRWAGIAAMRGVMAASDWLAQSSSKDTSPDSFIHYRG